MHSVHTLYLVIIDNKNVVYNYTGTEEKESRNEKKSSKKMTIVVNKIFTSEQYGTTLYLRIISAVAML